MFTSKFLPVLPLLLLGCLPAFSASLGADAANLAIPVAGANTMDVLASFSGETRIYYQNSTTRGITELSVTNAFNTGHFERSLPIVPAAEIRFTSPVAVAAIGDPWAEARDTQSHFFDIKYIWTASSNTWQGGASCNICLTSDQYVASGSNMLYAVATTSSSSTTWRVGFVSAGVSNTITEVINTGSGWILAPLSA